MIICGSSLRPPTRGGPAPLVRMPSDTGCAGLSVDGDCPLDAIAALAAEARRAGLPLVAIAGPQPPERLPRWKVVPRLAAFEDKEERLAAVKLAGRLLETARDQGASR